MNRPPEPPPEGVLIEQARRAARLSVREAARRAGISEGWWRQVVKGYQSLGDGSYVTRHAPADTVAKLAAVVKIAPEQLETEGRRPDAAESLREMERQPPVAPVPAAPAPAEPVDDLADVRVLLEGVERAKMPVRGEFDRVMKIVREFPPGVLIPGVVLYDDPRYQRAWDELAGREYSPGRVYTPARMALVIAVQQFRDQRRAARDDSGQGGMAAGLSRAP